MTGSAGPHSSRGPRRARVTPRGFETAGGAPGWGSFARATDPLLGAAGSLVGPRNPRLPRLDRQTVAALLAVHFALEDGHPPGVLVLGVEDGSVAADRAYWASAREAGGALASPLLFSATLPSAIAGEIAMTFGLEGPCVVLAGAGACETCASLLVPEPGRGTGPPAPRLTVGLRGWALDGADGEAWAELCTNP